MSAVERPFEAPLSGFADDTRRGLTARPKTLPSKYFYDALGSRLFEAICSLPWYPVTRAENALLDRYAHEMIAPIEGLTTLIELGSGSGDKLARVARAVKHDVAAHLVDVSTEALDQASRTLARIPHVEVVAHAATYEPGLLEATRQARRGGSKGNVLVLFLGSNIGNFDDPRSHQLLVDIRRALRPGDGLLLGTDLVRKKEDLIRAYDDPLGVTAAFNKNVLRRLNDELGANFDLAAFCHQAIWNERDSRVEMHLRSRRRQKVLVPGAQIEASFDEGETIWTESSYKYSPESVVAMGARAGLDLRAQWVEPDLRFGETLFVAE